MGQKTDIRKYLILYHYGGVVSDLDVESLEPLDEFLQKHRYNIFTYVLSKKFKKTETYFNSKKLC